MLKNKAFKSRALLGFFLAILVTGIGFYGCGSGSNATLTTSAGAVIVPPPAGATVAITAVADAGGGNITITTPNTLAAGAIIVISGTTSYNGTFTVVSATPTSFTVAAAFTTTQTGVWQPGGGLIAGCTPTTTGTAGAIVLPSMTTIPTRLTGVAPLAVYFDASATTATGVARPFHDLEYRWGFGDAGSGNWGDKGTGASGTGVSTSRNSARGPVAAHVYETPGTYILNLTVTDGTNSISNSCIQIAVQDPDVVYAGANTVCVSATSAPVGGAGGCPAGASGVVSADFCTAVTANKGTGKRILFKAGETFACAGGTTINDNGPWTVGSYGGGLAKVVSNQAAGRVIGVGAGAGIFPNDGRIMDLEITTSAPAGNTLVSIRGVGNMDDLTLLRLNVHDIGDGPQFLVDFINLPGNTRVWDRLTIADTTVKTITGGSGTHGLFIFASRVALLGNLIDDTFASEHLIRASYLNGAIVNHNTLRNSAAGKETFALRGVENNPAAVGYHAFVLPAPSPTQKVVISDNSFALDTPEGLKVGPANSTIQSVIKDIISERNYYHAPVTTACGGGLCANTAILTQADGHTIRNEIVRWDNFKFYVFLDVQAATTGMAAGTNVNFYNNTAFSSLNSAFGNVTVATLQAGSSNVNMKNNLIYVPSATGTTTPVSCVGLVNCVGYAGLVETNNSTGSASTNQIKLASPNFAITPPVTLTDFKPLAGSYATALGAGATVPVWSDFFLVSRPPHHMGAALP